MSKVNLALQPSEAVVTQCAANIYAAYVMAGRATEGKEEEWMKRSLNEAIKIALWAEDAIKSDSELG